MAYSVLDLTSSIQDDLTDPSFSSARILRYLNAAQRAVFNTHSFRFSETSATGTLSQGASTLAMPATWQSTIQLVLTDDDDSDRHFVFDMSNYLLARDLYELFPVPANNDEAMPSYWSEYGGTMVFSCPLDDDYAYTLRFQRVPAELTATSDVPTVPEAFRELLEMYVLHRAEKYRGNHDVAATYKAEYDELLEQMTIRSIPASGAGFHVMTPSRTRTGDA